MTNLTIEFTLCGFVRRTGKKEFDPPLPAGFADVEFAQYFNFDKRQLVHKVFHVKTCPAHASHRIGRFAEINAM
jgi:hypothetical protein